MARMGSMAAMSFDEMSSSFGQDQALPRALDNGRRRGPAESGGNDYEALSRLDENNAARGLSVAALRGLAKRRVAAGERVEDLISRSVLAPGAVVYELPCGHCLERANALRWFQRSRCCPVCRREIEA